MLSDYQSGCTEVKSGSTYIYRMADLIAFLSRHTNTFILSSYPTFSTASSSISIYRLFSIIHLQQHFNTMASYALISTTLLAMASALALPQAGCKKPLSHCWLNIH